MGLPMPQGHQRDVVYLAAHGHHVVLGTAGTGKTVMAIHRAAHLADVRTQNHGPVLLLTYNNSLVTYLRHQANNLPGVAIETYGKFGRGYLASQGKMTYNQIADPDVRRYLVGQAVKTVAARHDPSQFFDRSTDFFLDELEWIDGNGLATLADYLAVNRVGRMAPLQPSQREAVWEIRQAYVAARIAAHRPYDWPAVPSAVRCSLATDTAVRRYKHVVVDEAQDLSPEAIRSLAEAIPADGSLTLFGDYAQQIYGQRISWRSCGLKVQKIEIFLDNYRNSPEIARLAIAMAQMPHFQDSADLVEPRASQRAAGAKPTLVRYASVAEETTAVAATAASFGKVARVGILTRTRAEARLAVQGLQGVHVLHENLQRWQVGAGVHAGTYHSAKGLEFDVVILPFCGADRCPDKDTVAAFGYEEAASRESRLLYVGVTRARDELIITHTGDPTPLLPPVSSDLYHVTT
ncbi:3'-5' exonuclease [Cryptosporangium sp. NPDC048952]|uniref:3'-5' exonuclease n=1 Tax=Cryptosporangium sp. NPDC048952 TaxID=3363961 RepID=UPI003721B8C7